jgi:hypothetical protein
VGCRNTIILQISPSHATDRVLATHARRRGEFAFKAAGREIGHLHGDHAAHFGFPTDIWSALFDEGRIDYHPVFPGRAGFGARRIETEVDVDQVIAIMRINYERVITRHGVPSGTAA